MVQFCDDQLSLLGHDSIIDMLPGIRRVNVWNRGLEEGTAVAFIFWSAQHTLPTMWISWAKSSADLEMTPSSGMSKYLVLSPEAG